MKPILTLAFSFVLAIQGSFAQKTLPSSMSKFANPLLTLDTLAAPQSASSDHQPCSSPTIIECGVPLYNQDNYGATSPIIWTSNFNDVSYNNCLSFPGAYEAPDRLYKFTLSFSATVNIHMTNITGSDLDIFLLTNCSPANCYLFSFNGGASDEDISTFLDPGTYYIVVDGFLGNTGNFDLSLDFEGGCTRPCENPPTIACGQTLTFQNNFSASGWKNNFNNSDYSDCNIPNWWYYGAPDRIYQFELDAITEVNIKLEISDPNKDLDLFLLSYCSPTVCYERGVNDTQFNYELIITTLNPGVYYIVVDGYGSDNAQSLFNLSLECGGNGDCSNPTILNCGSIVTGQTTIGQPNHFSANAYSACGIPGSAPYSAPDKLYKFTLDNAEEVNISLEVLSSGANLDLFLLSSCSPAVCYAYSNTTTSFESIQASLPAGTYYVLVEGYGSSQGSFNIQLSCNCTCIEALDLGVLRSCEGFEGFVNNAAVSPNSVRWNKWSSTAGDAVVRTDASNKYLEMKPAGAPTPDVWFNLGLNTTGRYRLSFQMMVETGKNGNYYMLHQAPNASGANSNTAYRVVFGNDGTGYLRLALSNTNTATFKYPNGGWVDVVQIIDLNQDVVELWIGGTFVHSWKYSVGSNGNQLSLESLNFDADDASYNYRIDNICFRAQGSCTLPPGGTPVCVENGTQLNNMATAKCKLYTEDETQPCNTVCDYGGRFIYRGDKFSGTFDASDRAPWSVRNQPCVQQAYGNNVPPSLYADIYIFSRRDNDAVIINYSTNGNPNVKAFVFVCNSDQDGSGVCVDGEVCWEALPSSGTNIAINTCHDFYYLVITGTLGETYSNVSILPNGICPPNPELITCGTTISGSVGSQGNPPSIPFNTSTAPYLQCYNGFRTYTGDESFYKLVLNQPSKITVNLTASAPSPSGMGVFLFSFLCGGNCLGYAENTAFNPSAALEVNLNEGIYYLVVDKATNAGNSNFTLSLNCEPHAFVVSVNDVLTGDFNCPTDAVTPSHTVNLVYNPVYVPSDYFEFYFRDTNGQLKNNLESNKYWHNSSQPLGFNLRRDDPVTDQVKCSYIQGDTFYVFMHQTEDNNATFKQYKPSFAPATGGGVTDSLKFRPGGFSLITKLTEINAINFVPEFASLTVLPGTTTRFMDFSSGQPWAVEKVNDPANWLTIDPTHSNTAERLALTFQENTTPKPRSVVLRFYTSLDPNLYQQFVLVTQQGRCEIPQPVNIVATNTNVCAGTPVSLTADVGANFVDVYNYLWSNGSTNTSITVTPAAPSSTYSVTVTNKYCFITSDDVQVITATQSPNAPTAIDASICQGQPNAQSVSVVAQPGVQVFWYSQISGGNPLSPNPSNSYTPVPQPTVTTTYFAESVQNSCKSLNRTPVTLTVNPKPTFLTTDTICNPGLFSYTVVITILNGNTVTTTPSFPVTFNPANGTYTVSNIPKGTNVTLTVTNTGTTCSNTKLVTSPVCLCGAVNAPVTNNPQDYCPGETPPLLTASVGNGEIAEWYNSPSSPNPIITGPFLQPNGPGTYWVQSRNTLTQCVSPRIAVQEILLARPTFEVSAKSCSPTLNSYSVQFHSDGEFVTAPPYSVNNLSGGNFEITGIAANQSLNIHLVDAATGCQRDTLVPPATCGCPTNIPKPTTNTPLINPCQGSPSVPALVVTVPNGLSANWYRNGQLQFGSPNTQFQATIAGDYWAKTYDPVNHCESLDSTKITLQFKPLPTLSLVDKSCDNSWQNYQVIVSSNTTILSSVPNIAPSDNGNSTYRFEGIPIATSITITATANGCDQSITINPPLCSCTVVPAAPQNPNNPSMCLGGTIPILSVTISNPATETVEWYDAASGGNLLPNPSVIKSQFQPTSAPATKDYYAEAKFIQNGCANTTRTKVTLRVDMPATSFAGADATICVDQGFSLNGTIGGSASTGTWSATPLGGSFSPNSGFFQAQTYTPPQNFQGGTITISLTGFPTQPSVCPSVTDKMLLDVNPLPTFTVLSEECEPNLNFYSIIFNTDADDIEFSPNIGILNLNPDNSYTYGHIPEGTPVAITVRFISTGCDRTVNPPVKNCNCTGIIPKPTSLGDKKVCEGIIQYPILEVSVPAGFTVNWFNAQTNGTLLHSGASFPNPPGPGNYWAEAKETFSTCVSERTLVKLEIAPNPIADAGPDQEACPGSGNLTLMAVQSGVADSYSWSNGQIGPVIQVPVQNATYTLTVVLGDCVDYDTVNVSALPGISAINFNQDNIHCNGGIDGSLTAIPVGGIPPFNYLWSNGITTATNISLLTGTYTVTITNSQACSITASATITQPLPLAIANAIIQHPTDFLNNGSIEVEMTGGTMPYQYQWLYLNNTPFSGQTSNLLDSVYADKYKVRVTDANGCIFISSPFMLSGTNDILLADQIQVFPNPTSGKVYLRSNLQEQEDAQIEAFDMLGRLLIQERRRLAPGDVFEIDLSNRPSGIYMLKISLKEGAFLTKKISVKK